ncbi:MAG: arginine--tRNA ligase [Longimicrobiales bacterium]|nr:arginine--tRNA ligase [Longimicrobiales bacterium]
MDQDRIRRAVQAVLAEMGAPVEEVLLERPRDPTHGDLATNVAMTLARALKRPPREIAHEIADRMDRAAAGVTAVEVAGPGFLNFRFSSASVAGALPEIVAADADFGRSRAGGRAPVVVEWVSANPTGPLHVGHGRQAALGDAIATLLEWTGWAVHREYYYNDSGKQMENLALSVRARYRQALGVPAELPEGGYQGEYVKDVARAFLEREGDRYRSDDSDEALDVMRRFAVEVLRAEQDRDLTDFRVRFDEYFLESSLYLSGEVERTVERLRATGLVYEHEGAVWLRTTEFGDDKDRVMLRGDGTPTYFLPDVAYHMNKWERGFHHAINVQGADHHGTVARVRAGVQALGVPAGYPEYVLHQMVRVVRDGREVKFSKRAGSYTTLRDLFDEAGVDVTRYFLQMRKPEGHLVFDLDAALDHSEKNPVYKIQYAHARMHAIFRKAGVAPGAVAAEGASLARLDHELERDLVQRLADFPGLVGRAAQARAPHLVCDYLEQLAGAVNAWYHAGNPSRNPELAVLADDPELRGARLVLSRAVQIVLRNGLRILGIEAPERMVREAEPGPVPGSGPEAATVPAPATDSASASEPLPESGS